MASPTSSGPSCRDLDNTVRAGMRSCRGGFDFSLLFEETILEILPISLIVIAVPFRIWQLSQKRRKVVGSWLLLLKLVSILFLSEISTLGSCVTFPFGGSCLMFVSSSIGRLLGYFSSDFKSPKPPSGLCLEPIGLRPQLRPMPS